MNFDLKLSDDPRLGQILYRHSIARELFNRISDYNEEDMVRSPEEMALMIKSKDFASLTTSDKIHYLALERAEILYASIYIQEEVFNVGKQRTITLCNEKDKLSRNFNSETLLTGLKRDIEQQSTDMAIMITLSNSALLFAKQFAPEKVETQQDAVNRIYDMKSQYHEFVASLDLSTYTYAIPNNEAHTPSPDPIAQITTELEELYEVNINLAGMIQDRFENGIQSLYYWQELLGYKPKTEPTGDEFFDKFCRVKDDWEYEVEIQGLLDDRVQILTTRAMNYTKYIQYLNALKQDNKDRYIEPL